MIPLTDEDYWVAEPCVGCKYVYVEDIWHEFCCDQKECIYPEEYKEKEEIYRRKKDIEGSDSE
jgi:hypothetical protein